MHNFAREGFVGQPVDRARVSRAEIIPAILVGEAPSEGEGRTYEIIY